MVYEVDSTAGSLTHLPTAGQRAKLVSELISREISGDSWIVPGRCATGHVVEVDLALLCLSHFVTPGEIRGLNVVASLPRVSVTVGPAGTAWLATVNPICTLIGVLIVWISNATLTATCRWGCVARVLGLGWGVSRGILQRTLPAWRSAWRTIVPGVRTTLGGTVVMTRWRTTAARRRRLREWQCWGLRRCWNYCRVRPVNRMFGNWG